MKNNTPSTRKTTHEPVLEEHGTMPGDGKAREAVDGVRPAVDGGRFAVKRIAGEPMQVEAHAFTDGHDAIRVLLHWRAERDAVSHEVEMQPEGNDVWSGSFVPPMPGRYI